MTKPIHVGLVYGSTREGRFCDTVVHWAETQLASRSDFSMQRIDPRAMTGPAGDAPEVETGLAGIEAALDRSDAFIVVTPEYNHSFPAALKHLIDTVGSPWQGKPVAFVSYGGGSGGIRAVEQLRQVFAEMRAATIRDTVMFQNAWQLFDEAGTLYEPQRPERSMKVLLDNLHWWASALRTAREGFPHGEAA